MAVVEDEIIKRKLLIEGDGGNDEKRINGLLKTFIKWTSSADAAEESCAGLTRMFSTLAQCQLTMQKSTQVYNMNLKEQENYDKINADIDNLMAITQKQIKECKDDLRTARCIRKNKQEYDLLAKVIQTNPDRYETSEHLKAIDQELLKLEETKMKFKEMLNMRKKHFYVLLCSIHELQRMLEDDSQLNDDEFATFEAMDTN